MKNTRNDSSWIGVTWTWFCYSGEKYTYISSYWSTGLFNYHFFLTHGSLSHFVILICTYVNIRVMNEWGNIKITSRYHYEFVIYRPLTYLFIIIQADKDFQNAFKRTDRYSCPEFPCLLRKYRKFRENALKSNLCIRKTSEKFYHNIFYIQCALKTAISICKTCWNIMENNFLDDFLMQNLPFKAFSLVFGNFCAWVFSIELFNGKYNNDKEIQDNWRKLNPFLRWW